MYHFDEDLRVRAAVQRSSTNNAPMYLLRMYVVEGMFLSPTCPDTRHCEYYSFRSYIPDLADVRSCPRYRVVPH